jgi:hypothetical protein
MTQNAAADTAAAPAKIAMPFRFKKKWISTPLQPSFSRKTAVELPVFKGSRPRYHAENHRSRQLLLIRDLDKNLSFPNFLTHMSDGRPNSM